MPARTTNLTGLGMPPALAEQIGIVQRTTTPAASLTPMYIGQIVVDTVAGVFYGAAGLTNADWKAFN